MVVQNLTPTRYGRIKAPRTHSMSWGQAKLDFPPYFVCDLKRSKFSDLARFNHLQRHFITADAFSSIGDVLFIYQFKNAQINSTLNKYYSFSPTSVALKWSKVKPSLPSLVKSRIQQLERLPNAWDSYSARPIDARAIAAAKSLLIRISSDLAPELISDVFIAPCSDGGIQLEWELNSKELIIKITPNGQERFFLFVSSSGTEEEGAIISEAKLDRLLQGILSP
jgi:hypothetical protein